MKKETIRLLISIAILVRDTEVADEVKELLNGK